MRTRVHTVWPQKGKRSQQQAWSIKKKQHVKSRERLNVSINNSHLIWYFMVEVKGKSRKTETFVCHQTPWGCLCFFGAPELCSHQTACLTVTSQRCLPPTRPLSKTRGWEAHLSLTQFSQFSALVCDGKRMKAWSCAIFWKARVRVESPSQMALCQTMAAAPDSHRWRAQEEKQTVASEQKTWKKFLGPYETRHLMCVDSIRVHAHLCFCFHLLPCHHSLVFAHG